MNGSIRIARRYAESFFGMIAGEAWRESILADIRFIEQLFRDVPEFRIAVSTPHLRGEKRIQLIEGTIRDRVHPATWQFILFLQSKRRLDLLSDVCTAVLLCQERSTGRRRVSLDIAYDTTDDVASDIAAAIVELPPERLIVEKLTKPQILGGFRLLMDDKLYDYSTAGAMRRLQKRMMTSSLGKD